MNINLAKSQVKIKRNDPCWCGSGLKYKFCHLNREVNKKVIPRSVEFIDGMRAASSLAAKSLKMLVEYIKPQITTNRLDELVYQYLKDNKAIPASLNYQGFPKSICISINEVVCHGIPSERTLKEGDIVSIDIACNLNGYFGDTCKTFAVGECSSKAKKLMQVTEECLMLGIGAIRPYQQTNEIGRAIEKHAKKNQFSVVECFVGHGIGRQFHESPQILHFYKKNYGTNILPGMFFTIEPMINEGVKDLKILKDNWTAVTLDGKLSAQYEHTIMVTETGVEILT